GQPEFGLGLNLPAALPRLNVPTGIGLRMRGMSTSPGRIRQEATLARMPHSLAALRSLFGEQLQAQSWRETARWMGTRSAGISVEKVLDGGRVGGVLELLHLDDGGTE